MTAGGVAHASRRQEARLIAGVLRGDERAFRQLYRCHTPYLYRLALRLTADSTADAEDIIQEAWRRAVEGLSRFEGRSAIRTWLRSIVVNCTWELLRRRRPADTDEAQLPARANGRGGPWTRVDLERAFQALPPGFRAVLVLHDVEGYRHEDIAGMLGVTAGTSKSQLSRARARMRRILGEDYARE